MLIRNLFSAIPIATVLPISTIIIITVVIGITIAIRMKIKIKYVSLFGCIRLICQIIYESKAEVKCEPQTNLPSKSPVFSLSNSQYVECFVCQGYFKVDAIDAHVNKCLEQNEIITDQSIKVDPISEARRKEEEENERYQSQTY